MEDFIDKTFKEIQTKFRISIQWLYLSAIIN
jgi:hypothetical protein